VLEALDPGGRGRDEHGSARLPDGERDAGVGADVRLLQGDGIRAVLRYQPRDPVEDRAQTELQPLLRARSPPPVAHRSEATIAFVDDSVPASSRPWIDAQDLQSNSTFTRRG